MPSLRFNHERQRAPRSSTTLRCMRPAIMSNISGPIGQITFFFPMSFSLHNPAPCFPTLVQERQRGPRPGTTVLYMLRSSHVQYFGPLGPNHASLGRAVGKAETVRCGGDQKALTQFNLISWIPLRSKEVLFCSWRRSSVLLLA